MGTPYTTIYNRFLLKITDYSLTELPDAVVDVMMHGYLMSSVADISVRELREHVSEFDDSQGAFVYELSNLEQEILALGMVEAWVEPMINSITVTQLMIGTKQTSLEAVVQLLYGALHLETVQCIPSYMRGHLARLCH